MMLQTLDDGQGMGDVLDWRDVVLGARHGRDDFAVRADHEGCAREKPVVDVLALDGGGPLDWWIKLDAVQRADGAAGVGGDGELAGAEFGITLECVEHGN